MEGQPLKVLVIDDHDDAVPYLLTGIGHYPVKTTYVDEDSGTLVVVLEYHKLFSTVRNHILNPPRGHPSHREPGEA